MIQFIIIAYRNIDLNNRNMTFSPNRAALVTIMEISVWFSWALEP